MKVLTKEEAYNVTPHLKPVGILNGISEQDLEEFKNLGEWVHAEDEIILSDGQEHKLLYIICQGKVEVYKFDKEKKKKRVFVELGEDQCFGEMAFVSGDPASANVEALGKTVLWRLNHDDLTLHLKNHPASSGQLYFNLASILSQRVREGNTRILGLTSSLSAYFGYNAITEKDIKKEAPRASGMADMEIPEEVFDSFVIDTLDLSSDAVITDEQRDDIDKQIKAGDVDFISWLESGEKGRKLKVLLKFVRTGPSGEILDDSLRKIETDQNKLTPRIKMTGGLVDTRKIGRTRVIKVPQAQTNVASTPVIIKKQSNKIWKIISISSWVVVSFLVLVVATGYIPFEKRVKLLQSSFYQKLPLKFVVDLLYFQALKFDKEFKLTRFNQFEVDLAVPRIGLIDLDIVLKNKLDTEIKIQATLLNVNEDPVFDKLIKIQPGEIEAKIFYEILKEGDYKLVVMCLKTIEENPPDASISIITRH